MRYFWLFVLLVGCAPSCEDDFRNEGESLARHLIYDLRKIKNVVDLQKSAPKLRKRFDSMVELMILAKKHQLKHPEAVSSSTEPSSHLMSDVLLLEYKRIYDIEGCRELMEEIQRGSLHKLDAYDRSISTTFEKRGVR